MPSALGHRPPRLSVRVLIEPRLPAWLGLCTQRCLRRAGPAAHSAHPSPSAGAWKAAGRCARGQPACRQPLTAPACCASRQVTRCCGDAGPATAGDGGRWHCQRQRLQGAVAASGVPPLCAPDAPAAGAHSTKLLQGVSSCACKSPGLVCLAGGRRQRCGRRPQRGSCSRPPALGRWRAEPPG